MTTTTERDALADAARNPIETVTDDNRDAAIAQLRVLSNGIETYEATIDRIANARRTVILALDSDPKTSQVEIAAQCNKSRGWLYKVLKGTAK